MCGDRPIFLSPNFKTIINTRWFLVMEVFFSLCYFFNIAPYISSISWVKWDDYLGILQYWILFSMAKGAADKTDPGLVLFVTSFQQYRKKTIELISVSYQNRIKPP